jgi:DNA-binding NarL/FixJ family response regulator
MIRVAVADDHHLVREGIRALLEKAGDIEVVGEAVDGIDAVELVQSVVPDVLLIDIAMPRLNGIQALERLRALGAPTQVVVLSMYSDETLVDKHSRTGREASCSRARSPRTCCLPSVPPTGAPPI